MLKKYVDEEDDNENNNDWSLTSFLSNKYVKFILLLKLLLIICLLTFTYIEER